MECPAACVKVLEMSALFEPLSVTDAGLTPDVAAPLATSAYLDFIATPYDQMAVAIEGKLKTAWVHFSSETSPSFSRPLLQDLLRFKKVLAELFESSSRADAPVKFVVSASRMPGIYNLGGDLALFADCIRRQDRQALGTYARECCEMVYHGYTAFKLPVVLVGLIQGDALGGGLECALSCGVLVAERKARFGIPEILFNMFPGMGAYSLLSRRIGQIEAERMILSGKIYTAEEMFDMGLVDILAEDGEGEKTVQDYIASNLKRHGTLKALHDVRRRVGGLDLQELLDVTERWVDEAMNMDESSLKRMERLRSAQARRVASNKTA
jgi:DSF synthase